MTVSAQTPYSSQAANSVTTSFPFAYKIRSNTDIVVVLVDASGNRTTQTLGVHYTVSGVGSPTGGSVDFTSAPATGMTVKTYRVTGLARSTDYQNNGDLLAAILNGDVDAVWLALQEIISGTQAPVNALRAPIGEVLSALVPAADRANKALVFDGSGGVAVSADIPAQVAAAAASAATAQAAATQAQTAIPPVQVVDYPALRAYAGTATTLRVTGYLVTAAPAGTAGTFTRDDSDTTSSDNGGTIIVASNGKRWKRVYDGPLNIRWFGVKGDGTDEYAAIQSGMDASQYSTLYFPRPPVFYGISQSLNYKTQTRLLGDGIGTTIKAVSTWAATPPAVATAGGYSPTLSYAPLLYNAASIQWWSIEGLNFDGNGKNCYGIWLMANFYGSIRDVYVTNTNKRPYTNIYGQAVVHESFVCYGCGDGIVTYDNTNLKFLGGGFERLSGAWSFDQRQPNSFAKGGVTLDDVWFESDLTNFPTQGFLRMSGRRNRAFIHANLATAATTERSLELNDTADSLVVDGITMGANPCSGGEFTVNDAGSMAIKASAGSYGNRVRGAFTNTKVTDSGKGNTFDVNASLATPAQHVTGRFQVRYGDNGSGIPLLSSSIILDADYNAGAPIIRMLGNVGNTLDLNSGRLRLSSALGQDYVATSGGMTWTASQYVFNNSSGATGYSKPVFFGAYALWVDSLGKLRIKNGAPTSDADGTVVGTQT